MKSTADQREERKERGDSPDSNLPLRNKHGGADHTRESITELFEGILKREMKPNAEGACACVADARAVGSVLCNVL